MIYLEGPAYPEFLMHIFDLKCSGTPKYRNMLGNSLQAGPAQQTKDDDLKYSGCPETRNMLLCILFLHKVFPGILEAIISNGLVLAIPAYARLSRENLARSRGYLDMSGGHKNYRMRQGSREDVIQRRRRPKRCFWRLHVVLLIESD